MHIEEFFLPGFYVHGSGAKHENGLEDRLALYRTEGRELVAAFSSTTRISNGEQCVNTNSQFIQHNYLTKAEIEALRGELQRHGLGEGLKLESAHRAFNLALGVGEVFRNGTSNEKMDALLETGSNLLVKDRNLSIYHTDLFSVIVGGLKQAKLKNPEFEPKNTKADKDETDTFMSVCPTLLARWYEFRTSKPPHQLLKACKDILAIDTKVFV